MGDRHRLEMLGEFGSKDIEILQTRGHSKGI
jgi:hypothetical protein